MNKVSRVPRAEQWARQIRDEQGKCVESIIEVGRLLVKAKSDLPHGEWGRMFNESLVPFSRNSAARFMAIATSPVLTNSDHSHHLPASWQTLYQLSRVPEPTLKNALADGVITPDMPRKAVKELLPVGQRRPHRGPVVNEPDPFDAEIVAARVIHFIRGVIADWPQEYSLDELVETMEHELSLLKSIQVRRAS